jgi:hypothetical protein
LEVISSQILLWLQKWCANAREKGITELYSASYIYAPHIMHQEMLEAFTKGGDPRISVAFENMVKI